MEDTTSGHETPGTVDEKGGIEFPFTFEGEADMSGAVYAPGNAVNLDFNGADWTGYCGQRFRVTVERLDAEAPKVERNTVWRNKTTGSKRVVVYADAEKVRSLHTEYGTVTEQTLVSFLNRHEYIGPVEIRPKQKWRFGAHEFTLAVRNQSAPHLWADALGQYRSEADLLKYGTLLEDAPKPSEPAPPKVERNTVREWANDARGRFIVYDVRGDLVHYRYPDGQQFTVEAQVMASRSVLIGPLDIRLHQKWNDGHSDLTVVAKGPFFDADGEWRLDDDGGSSHYYSTEAILQGLTLVADATKPSESATHADLLMGAAPAGEAEAKPAFPKVREWDEVRVVELEDCWPEDGRMVEVRCGVDRLGTPRWCDPDECDADLLASVLTRFVLDADTLARKGGQS